MRKKIGKYRLDSELGRGGMGTVWSAWDSQLERNVAIKLANPIKDGDEALRERFAREARAVAKLQTPHVVRLFDYGIADDDTPYAVMELLNGEDLKSRLIRTKTIPSRVLAEIIVHVARGLDAAHQAGVIHRDLKPANIFLCREGHRIVAKVVDFGLATVRSQHALDGLTDSYQLIGTPQYMSPEQARSEPVGITTDLWSLGVVAYEALIGQRPFQASSLGSTILKICTERHTPPSALNSHLNSAFDDFFERALAKSPDERFSSADEMATALMAIERRHGTRHPIKILVVDDEPDVELLMQQRFRKQIRQRHYELLFANGGKQALAVLQDHPDTEIALVDLNMPGMSGLTLLGHLSTRAPILRSVVVSAYGDMSNIRRAMNTGAFDFLVKPIDFNDLATTVDKAAKIVRELQQAVRSLEASEALSCYVDPKLQQSLGSALRSVDTVVAERFEATALCIRLESSNAAGSGGAGNTIRRLNKAIDEVASALYAHRGLSIRFVNNKVTAIFNGHAHRIRALNACFQARRAVANLSPVTTTLTGETQPSVTLEAEAEQWSLHIGAAWGQVTTGTAGSNSLRRYAQVALGEPVEQAQHLASIAPAESVLIPNSLCSELPENVRTAPYQHEQAMASVAGAVEVVALNASARKRTEDGES